MADHNEDARQAANYVSMGRNPNIELTCCAPRCAYLHKGPQNGGWCQHPANRVPPCDGWPTGFTPSVASTGGCDRHSAALKATGEKGEKL